MTKQTEPDHTIVHLVRHGEVDNPTGVLYGRLPGFHLSPLGHQMAERIAESLGSHDIRGITASPLERTQETATPLARLLGLPISVDERLIEAGNKFQGNTFGVGDGSLRRPANWPLLWNPMRPSWGEAYVVIAARMREAVITARDAARGGEAVCVSHQLPIWTIRSAAERRRLWHDPRNRQCTLASVTSLTFDGERLISVGYAEPARDLLPVPSAAVPAAGA